MADYYTQYSAEIDKLTDAEIKWLEARLKDIEDARANDDDFSQDEDDLGQVELQDRTLWFCGGESGDPQAVADFVQSLRELPVRFPHEASVALAGVVSTPKRDHGDYRNAG